MGTETVGDFVKQRRRNHAGHLNLCEKYGYKVSSLDSAKVVRLALDEIWSALRLIWVLFALTGIEAYARILGWWDYRIHKRTHVVWDIAWTTKEVKRPVNTLGINITSPHSSVKRD